MSTKYFLLSQSKNDCNDESVHTFMHNSVHQFILPEVNINYYITHGLFEQELINWCKQFCDKDKDFLDIGAHSGTYSISLASYSKNVYAFEPQRLTFYSLCGSVALSNLKNVYCYNTALGSNDQEGEGILKIISDDGGGSYLSPIELSGESNGESIGEEKVIVKTLDSYKFRNVGFIKIDVEDNEYNVLLGGAETLRECGYPKIIFEVNENSKNKNNLFEFLTQLNYKIIKISGVYNMFLSCYS